MADKLLRIAQAKIIQPFRRRAPGAGPMNVKYNDEYLNPSTQSPQGRRSTQNLKARRVSCVCPRVPPPKYTEGGGQSHRALSA